MSICIFRAWKAQLEPAETSLASDSACLLVWTSFASGSASSACEQQAANEVSTGIFLDGVTTEGI